MINKLKSNSLFLNPPFFFGLILPLSLLLSSYFFALTAVFLIIKSPRKQKIDWIPLLVLSIPAIVPLLSVLFHNEDFSWSQLEVRIPFLVVAILVGFFNIDFNLLSKFKVGFVFGTLLAGLLLLITSTGALTFLSSTIFLELSYASLYSVMALIFLWYTSINIERRVKIGFTIILLFVIVFLGKLFFIAAGIIIALSAIVVKGTPLQSKFAIAFIVLSSIIVLYKGPGIQSIISRYQLVTEIQPNDKLGQWQCVLEIMKGNELLGVGFIEKNNLLQECYNEKGMIDEESRGFNAHNEYLDFFLTFGYAGLLLLAIYFLKASFVAYDNKLTAQLLIIILISMFCLIENVFTRQKGVMITSITYLLIFSNRDKPSKKDEDSTVNFID